MILAASVGNSALSVGLVDAGRTSRAVSTPHSGGPEALRETCATLISGEGLQIDGACLCSVVPDMTAAVTELCRHFTADVLVIDYRTDTGLTLRYAKLEELGTDRLVNVYAAWRLHGPSAVVVDLGTATTVDVIGADGTHYGGAIGVGMGSAARALHGMTARLPLVEPAAPVRAVGTSTTEAIRSGVFWGTVGLVDELVQRLTAEVGLTATVVATGGWSEIVGPRCRTVDTVDRWLTLKGLGLLWERLRGGRGARGQGGKGAREQGSKGEGSLTADEHPILLRPEGYPSTQLRAGEGQASNVELRTPNLEHSGGPGRGDVRIENRQSSIGNG